MGKRGHSVPLFGESFYARVLTNNAPTTDQVPGRVVQELYTGTAGFTCTL